MCDYTIFIVSLLGEKLVIGFTTRATLNRLVAEGDVSPQQVQKFEQAAVAFLESAVEYAMQRLPLKEPLIKHAMFVDVQQRVECGVDDALYFVKRLVGGVKFFFSFFFNQIITELTQYALQVEQL